MNLCIYTSGKHHFATPGVAFVGGFGAESGYLMRSSCCASPFAAKFRCRNPRFGVVSSVILAVSYTRISINLPYHSPSVMNSKVLHALMYLADRPRRRKWRLPLPPALWLLTRYIPVIQFSSASERTASRSKIPLYFLWRDRHRFERNKLKLSKKILSIRFVASIAG